MDYIFHEENGTPNRCTVVGVLNEQTKTLNVGIARCSKKDNFQRKKGRTIARGRALKNPFITFENVNTDLKTNDFIDILKNEDVISSFKSNFR